MLRAKHRSRRSADPASRYPSPRALAEDSSLSITRRVHLLKRWAFEERCQEVATGEGMPGAPTSRLQEISEALDALAESPRLGRAAAPTRLGDVRDERPAVLPRSRTLSPDPDPPECWKRYPRLSFLLVLAVAYGALAGLLVAIGGNWQSVAAATIGFGLVGLLALVRRGRGL